MNQIPYDELYHYGIKGMQWGVRRTPEELGHYKVGKTSKSSKTPKSSKMPKKKSILKKKIEALKKKSRESAKIRKEKRRKAILDDPGKLYKHRKEFSQEEIDKAMKKFDWENRLKQQSIDRVEKGKKTVNNILGITTSSISMYNQVARIYNTMAKTKGMKPVPYVENPTDDKQNKQNKQSKK